MERFEGHVICHKTEDGDLSRLKGSKCFYGDSIESVCGMIRSDTNFMVSTYAGMIDEPFHNGFGIATGSVWDYVAFNESDYDKEEDLEEVSITMLVSSGNGDNLIKVGDRWDLDGDLIRVVAITTAQKVSFFNERTGEVITWNDIAFLNHGKLMERDGKVMRTFEPITVDRVVGSSGPIPCIVDGDINGSVIGLCNGGTRVFVAVGENISEKYLMEVRVERV